MRTASPKTTSPVRPNVGLRIAYQKRLDKLIAEMHNSVDYWLSATYRANPPEMAADASPAMMLRAALRRLGRRWLRRFDALAPELARYFATDVSERSDAAFRSSLRRAGFTVKFKATAAQNDALQAIIGENVALIRSIPRNYLTQVEGSVMRSVQTGRDLGTLTKELQGHYGVTKRRAAFIARDQNNKATAVLTRTRQQELGITKAKWLHSAGGKTPRPEHVAFSGKTYDVATGAYLEGKWTWPGVEINCFPPETLVTLKDLPRKIWKTPFDGKMIDVDPVSYTHLKLPTILRV